MRHISQNACLIKNQQCNYEHHKGNNKSNIKLLIRSFFSSKWSQGTPCAYIKSLIEGVLLTSVGISKNINQNVEEKQLLQNDPSGIKDF